MELSSDAAMRLTQLQTIKQYVITNHNGVFDQTTANAMNQLTAGYHVFETEVDVDKIRQSIDWAEILDETNGMTDLQQFGFNTIFHNGTFNPSLENSRDGLIKIFDVQMPNTRAAVLADITRIATIAEQLLASDGTGPGGGDGSAAIASAVMGDGAEGDITLNNLIEADGVTLP